MVDSAVIKNIKMNQTKLSKSWHGMNSECIGRPGIYACLTSNKKHSKLVEYLRLEDERFRYF